MKTFISTTEAIDQLYDVTDFSYEACEAIIDHYEGIDDDFYFYPEHLGSEWTEKTAEEIMRDHDATPQEVCDNIDYFYEIEGLRIGELPMPCAYVFCKYFEQF